MSSSANFPTIRPSLLLDFANTQALDPRITFTRATTATYYDAKSSAVAEQNLVLQSQTFNTSWTTSNISLTANSVVAPDGTTTAYTLTSTATTGSHGLFQTKPIRSGETYSIYAKAGTSNFVALTGNGTSSFAVSACATFNLSTGLVASSSNCTASMVSVGSGWYRCIVANTTFNTDYFIIAASEGDLAPTSSPWGSYTGTGLNVYIWGAQLEQRSAVTAYTPTTTTAITNYIPTLLTAVANEARFDCNPTTRESLGLLIEEQRTNLVTYSSDFSNAAWTKAAVSVTSTANIAPDGTQTAQLVVENTASAAAHNVTATATGASTTNTLTMYAKQNTAGAKRWFYMYPQPPSGSAYAVYDLSLGTVTATGNGGTTTYVGSTITAVGNGWYRCSITFTGTAGSVIVQHGLSSSGAIAGATYTGDGFSGLFIWGAQLEAGAFATSYIPTVASQVTRSADSASMTGTNFSSWYNIAQGTVYSEASMFGINASAFNMIAEGASASDFKDISLGFSNLFPEFTNRLASINNNIDCTAITLRNSVKVSGSYSPTTTSFASNGILGTAITTTAFRGGADRIFIGSRQGTVLFLNGYIKKLAYYPIACTNAQLQSLTG